MAYVKIKKKYRCEYCKKLCSDFRSLDVHRHFCIARPEARSQQAMHPVFKELEETM